MSKNFDSPIEMDFCGASGMDDPVPIVALPQLDPSPKNVAAAKDWIAILPHDSKSLQIALLSAEESRLEREDQLREAIAQRDAAQTIVYSLQEKFSIAEAALATERARVLQEALQIVRHTPQDGSGHVNDAVGYIESALLGLIRK